MSTRYQQLMGHRPQVEGIDRELERSVMSVIYTFPDTAELSSLIGIKKGRFMSWKPTQTGLIVGSRRLKAVFPT
jgi:hypothetical protein